MLWFNTIFSHDESYYSPMDTVMTHISHNDGIAVVDRG